MNNADDRCKIPPFFYLQFRTNVICGVILWMAVPCLKHAVSKVFISLLSVRPTAWEPISTATSVANRAMLLYSTVQQNKRTVWPGGWQLEADCIHCWLASLVTRCLSDIVFFFFPIFFLYPTFLFAVFQSCWRDNFCPVQFCAKSKQTHEKEWPYKTYWTKDSIKGLWGYPEEVWRWSTWARSPITVTAWSSVRIAEF